MTAVDGIIVVDKPPGWTSHDVVARVRRLVGARKVGHAGTLDPMATGVLVVGVLRATRLLGHLSATDKEYLATVRLGVATTTDDAEGEILAEADPTAVTDEGLRMAVARYTGVIEQVPSAVSAVKVDGLRAYARVRAGEAVALAPRTVTVSTFEILDRRGSDVDVRVVCTSGTYVRALARDVGAALGVGAHLTALRRTRLGAFGIGQARTLDELAAHLEITPLRVAVAAAFPRIDVDADTAQRLVFGQRVELAVGVAEPTGVFGPDGALVALVAMREGVSRSLVVFAAD